MMRKQMDRRRVIDGLAFTVGILTVALVYSCTAMASETDDRYHKPPQVIHVEHNDNDALVGVLIGAGITYWLVHRHKRQRPLVLIPPRTAECAPTVERVLDACGVAK
jgi:hypothetical protein